jgi:hypothetical protein
MLIKEFESKSMRVRLFGDTRFVEAGSAKQVPYFVVNVTDLDYVKYTSDRFDDLDNAFIRFKDEVSILKYEDNFTSSKNVYFSALDNVQEAVDACFVDIIRDGNHAVVNTSLLYRAISKATQDAIDKAFSK